MAIGPWPCEIFSFNAALRKVSRAPFVCNSLVHSDYGTVIETVPRSMVAPLDLACTVN